MGHELRFYETARGERPVTSYLKRQGKRVSAEAGWLLTRLESEGSALERPAADYVEDGIYELRVIVDRQQHRILYFFHGDAIVVTNAFKKKSGPVPKPEIERAKRARADWLAREAEGQR